MTVGTNWLAYGLLLFALLVGARRMQTRWTKTALALSGVLVALPYVVELVAHGLYGTTTAPHANYPTKFHAALPVVTLILVALIAIGFTTYQVAKSLRSSRTAWWQRLWLVVGSLSLLMTTNYALFWLPTPGPYGPGVTPFGHPNLEAVTTFGFTALGIWQLFLVACLLAPRVGVRWYSALWLAAGALVWLPHVVIVMALFGFGHGLHA